MKIVINKCYGGFSLSPRAVARLAELRGQTAYFIPFKGETPVPVSQLSSIFWSAYNTPTPTKNPSGPEWTKMSLEERKAHNAKTSVEFIDTCRDNRADPLLVQVVEEMGDAASGDLSELKIVEVPDGVEYELEEYDGMESIHEKHRVWE